MKRELRQTHDGSSTLFVAELDEHYHSIHGALQESLHVFIKAGLKDREEEAISILEVGFGTGLNAWLTAIASERLNKQIAYTSLEKYPLIQQEFDGLNYANTIGYKKHEALFGKLHEAKWEEPVSLNANFTLTKLKADLKSFSAQSAFNLIYFDAFAPGAQPNLWTVDIFKRMYQALKPGGTLVTYCAKGQVKRNMKAVGFTIEALPGPPGKREMTRARKA